MDRGATIVRTALAVLNAHSVGAPVEAQAVLRLREFAGPEAAEWDEDILASHVLALEARRFAQRMKVAGAGS